MGNQDLFNPGEFVFYFFGIILPTIMLLYSSAHAVFIIGEYETNNKQLPYIMLMTVIKLFINIITLIFVYDTLFDFPFNCFSLSALIILIWGFLICFDTLLVNKISYKIFLYKGELKFERFLDIKCKELFDKNKFLFYGKFLCLITLSLCCLASLFIQVFDSIYLLIFFYCLYILINCRIINYIKKIRKYG